jgi:hypothetical protein
VGLNAHPDGSLKPIDALTAEGLTLEGNQAGDDFIEYGDVVGKMKLQYVSEIVGFLDLAFHQKLALHQARYLWAR